MCTKRLPIERSTHLEESRALEGSDVQRIQLLRRRGELAERHGFTVRIHPSRPTSRSNAQRDSRDKATPTSPASSMNATEDV